jgi:hypothetical protein
MESESILAALISGNFVFSSSSSFWEPSPIIAIDLPQRGHFCGTRVWARQ